MRKDSQSIPELQQRTCLDEAIAMAAGGAASEHGQDPERSKLTWSVISSLRAKPHIIACAVSEEAIDQNAHLF